MHRTGTGRGVDRREVLFDASRGVSEMAAIASTPASITTPDRIASRLGTLEFDDGAPSAATVELLYDHLDFIHGV